VNGTADVFEALQIEELPRGRRELQRGKIDARATFRLTGRPFGMNLQATR